MWIKDVGAIRANPILSFSCLYFFSARVDRRLSRERLDRNRCIEMPTRPGFRQRRVCGLDETQKSVLVPAEKRFWSSSC